MEQKLIQLYQQMADLTRPKCGECRVPLSCCDSMYCDLAAEEAALHGQTIPVTGHATLPYMGPTGCTMPPHFRKLCTLHTCTINSIGADVHDMPWTKKYFQLRSKIEKAEYGSRQAAD